MNLLEWIGFKKVMKDLEPSNVVKLPLRPVEDIRPQEHYRVGFTSEGQTTLTLMSDNGNSMTLTMNRDACEQMIRMLRATYTDKEVK